MKEVVLFGKGDEQETEGKFSIHAEDLACAGISIILGTLASPLSYTLAFLYVSYSYMRTIREA